MKVRLDEYLVLKNLVINRSKAKQHIKNRQEVYVNNQLIKKAGYLVDSNCDIVELRINQPVYVSRAGLKLAKAVKQWKLDLTDLVCLDIGASTGGFTQVCLENNARLVYAVDVGTEQLVKSLKQDARVIDMSQYNFRYAKKQDFAQAIDFFCCDVSFIALDKILPSLAELIEFETQGIILLKPQFEVGLQTNNGKVNTQSQHVSVLEKFIEYAKKSAFEVIDISFSPILGNKKSNIEYLIYLQKQERVTKIWRCDTIIEIVKKSWKALFITIT